MLHDINKLRIFHYVAIEKSLTRAAPILKMKQSFVSKQIASLEKDLGKILFYRRFRGVDLTPDGEKLFSYTKDIMRQIDQLENNLLEEPQSKPLTIVTTTGVTHLWLLEKLRENEYFNSSSETLKIVLIDKELFPIPEGIGVALRSRHMAPGSSSDPPLVPYYEVQDTDLILPSS